MEISLFEKENRRNHLCVVGTVVSFNIVMMALVSYIVYQLDHAEEHIDEIYHMLKSNCTTLDKIY